LNEISLLLFLNVLVPSPGPDSSLRGGNEVEVLLDSSLGLSVTLLTGRGLVIPPPPVIGELIVCIDCVYHACLCFVERHSVKSFT
jgi:hypothetical protein